MSTYALYNVHYMHEPYSPPRNSVCWGVTPVQYSSQLLRYPRTAPELLFYLVFGAQVKSPKSRRQSHNNMMREYTHYCTYDVFAALLQTTKQYNELPPRRPPGGGLFIRIVIIIVINFFFNQKYKSSHNNRERVGEWWTKRLGAHDENIMCEHAHLTLTRQIYVLIYYYI